ncbi:MAG: hypothetical protein LIO90_06755 [Bacteroidales bacterium]|nr:hypothetical protein [Bacteroidales bacterium]
MKRYLLSLLFVPLFSVMQAQLRVVENYKIWSGGDYAAFPTFVKWNGAYYCAFREASAHRADKDDESTMGKIRVLTSKNLKKWTQYALLEEKWADLRDVWLSVTPDNRLMMIYYQGGYQKETVKNKNCSRVVFFSQDGTMTSPEVITIEGHPSSYKRIWKVRWIGDEVYGWNYAGSLSLVKSKDGVHYTQIYKDDPFGERATECDWIVEGKKAIAVARGVDEAGLMGKADYPFTSWTWEKMNIRVGGQDILRMPDNDLIMGTRNYQKQYMGRTSIYSLNTKKATASLLLTLNKQSDSSYPSMMLADGYLWVMYYSGAKGKSDIWLAKISY